MKFFDRIFAFHQAKENEHTVLVGLRVLITRDGDLWSAQGLEIDYAACGHDLADVKHRFVSGLSRTIQVYLEKYQSIESLIKQAPQEDWKEYIRSSRKLHCTIETFHLVPDDNEFRMINNVKFIENTAVA